MIRLHLHELNDLGLFFQKDLFCIFIKSHCVIRIIWIDMGAPMIPVYKFQTKR